MCVCVYVLQVANHQQVIPEVVNITIYLLDNFSSTEAKSVIRFLFLIRDLWFGSAGSFRSELIVTRPETQQSGWVGVNEYLFLDYSVCVGGGGTTAVHMLGVKPWESQRRDDGCEVCQGAKVLIHQGQKQEEPAGWGCCISCCFDYFCCCKRMFIFCSMSFCIL